MKHQGHDSRHVRSVVSVRAPEAGAVFVAGTFNGWNRTSHALEPRGDGQWVLPLDLPPGRYEYKFVIDGGWCCGPEGDVPYDGRPECVPNEFGTVNLVLEVADATRPQTRASRSA